MATEENIFFRKEREEAEIRLEIAGQFFPVWCSLMLSGKTPGAEQVVVYAGLQPDEPAFVSSILRSTFRNANFHRAVQSFFYTSDEAADLLEEKLQQLPFYEDLTYKPVCLKDEETQQQLRELLATGHPAFVSLNPMAEGFTQEILLNTGTTCSPDLLMLVDTDEVNAFLKKSKAKNQQPHFFTEQADILKAYYKTVRDGGKRETFVIDCLESIFRSKAYQTFLFKIKSPEKKEKSLYLLFASKTNTACTKLKELMLSYTDYQEDGVPLWGANLNLQQTALFHEHYTFSVLNLIQDLASKPQLYHNKTLQYIYEQHNPGTSYCRDNYTTAFQKLKEQGRVVFVNPKTGQTISTLTYTSIIRYKQ